MSREVILTWLLVYIVALSATTGAACYFDAISCGRTGDTREWMLQLIAVVSALIAGGKMKE